MQYMQIHHIQRGILSKLSESSQLRFSELQPINLANNTFTYHLKKLIELGYVEQKNKKYSATRKALKVAPYQENDEIVRTKSPLILTMLYITDATGNVLLHHRKRQPFKGCYGVPSGPIHQAEEVEDAARREFYEKTGLRSSKKLDYCGVLDFRYIQNTTNDIFVHAVGFVYRYNYLSEKPEIEDKLNRGELQWSKLDAKNILPEVNAVKMMVESRLQQVVSLNFMEP